MSRIAYVNGRYVQHSRAQVHVEDRGYQFADGIYEVIAVHEGQLLDLPQHFDRLERSLRELAMVGAPRRRTLEHVAGEVVARNGIRRGIVYIQITRGVAHRDHAFPTSVAPSVVVTARRLTGPSPDARERGVGVILVPDIRWQRCDIKSISLLPNVLAKQRAKEQGAFEAWQVDENGRVTEGTSTNAWIVDNAGNLITRQLDSAILSGITRLVLKGLAAQGGQLIIERAFSVGEAKAAAEAFLTSTTSLVLPVVQIDGTPVGSGLPGPTTRRLQGLFTRHLAALSATKR
ncbi:MAG: D-amino-acid transaminase [Alphaproteobacteria bacterium]|nr:D-amino-acid transaminase [Alphaproteobacteria bacterium]